MASSRSWFALALAAVVGVVCCGLWIAGLAEIGPALALQSGPEGIYAVSSSGESSVLLNTRTGKSWKLVVSANKTSTPVWLPIERLNTPNDIAKWRAEEEERSQNSVVERNRDREKGRLREQISHYERQLESQRSLTPDVAKAREREYAEKLTELKKKLAELGD